MNDMIVTLTVEFVEKQTKDRWISPGLESHLIIVGGYKISEDGYQGYVNLLNPSKEICKYFILMLEAHIIKGFMFGKVNQIP